MTPPPASPAALPVAEWLVGSEVLAATPLDATARQAARMEARRAVYAQHAAAIAAEATATAAGDAGQAKAQAERRTAAAEHFGELQAVVPAGATGPGGGANDARLPAFDALLANALVELDHQAAVDQALRERLLALRDAVVRGAGWAAADAPPMRALPSAPSTDASRPAVSAELPPAAADAPVRAWEGGWIAARADGVGRTLGGQYPGRVTRDRAAETLTAADRACPRPGMADRPAPGDRPAPARATAHVDLRF